MFMTINANRVDNVHPQRYGSKIAPLGYGSNYLGVKGADFVAVTAAVLRATGLIRDRFIVSVASLLPRTLMRRPNALGAAAQHDRQQ